MCQKKKEKKKREGRGRSDNRQHKDKRAIDRDEKQV